MFRYILTGYVESALSQAEYDKLEDGTYSGRIPPCKGVIALGKTLRECEEELRSTLEDWVLVGLKLGHPLPVIAGFDLNQEPKRESMATMCTPRFHQKGKAPWF
jgi:predicted RNase H-like HicB family nuclease